MRSLFIALGFTAAVSALVLAVTPLSQIAYLPAFAALIFGWIAFYISKRKRAPKKSMYLIFLLTTISLVLITYKNVFQKIEVEDLEELELIKETSNEDSKEILDSLEHHEIEINQSDINKIQRPEIAQ